MGKNKEIKIDTHVLPEKHRIAKRAGDNILIEFDKFFETDNKNLNLFKITKKAYGRNGDHISQYINIFIKYYDEDNEYLTSLLNLKYQIDSKSMGYTFNRFVSDVIEYILSDTMIEKIWKVVNEQYAIDLTSDEDLMKSDFHALQFENEHGKSLMAISMACKLTIPIISHYQSVRGTEMAMLAHSKGERPLQSKEYLYKIFCMYFPLFQGESNLFNKLLATVNMHIMKTNHSDSTMWKRAENRNLTPTIQLSKIIMNVIVDLVPKYKFTGNMITFDKIRRIIQ